MFAVRASRSPLRCVCRHSSTTASTSTSVLEPNTLPEEIPREQLQVAPEELEQAQETGSDAWTNVRRKIDERRAKRFTSSVFDQLGSTQNRSTTWQPHQSLSNPSTPVSVTQSHLLAAGAHLGHSTPLQHRAFLPHAYGKRGGITYIDTRQTLPALRRAAMVVRATVERDGIVLFLGSLKGTEKAVFDNARRLGPNGYGATRWKPGTISNPRSVFAWANIPVNMPDAVQASRSFKPSLLVLLSPNLNEHALREATANEIPTIGIIDSDMDPRAVTYAIPANDDSPRAVELIAGVLGMAGKDGLERLEEHKRMAGAYQDRSTPSRDRRPARRS